MLQPKLHKNLVRIVIAVLLCCSTGFARGGERTGPGSDTDARPGSNPAAPPIVVPPAAQSSSLALRDAKYYLQSTWSPRNVLDAGFLAGLPNLTKAPVRPQPPAVVDGGTVDGYESAMSQYSANVDDWRRTNEAQLRDRGRRFGFGLATAETRDLLSNFVLPVALRQDPSYVSPSLGLSAGGRLGFAAESVFVTRNNAGRRVPNFAKLGGTAGAALIARFLYADRLGVPTFNSNQFLWRYVGYSLAGDVATNITRELLRTAVRRDLIRRDEEGRVTDDNYYPLSTAGTLLFWARSTVAPRNFISGALVAGLPNIPTEPTYPVAPASGTKAGEIAYVDTLTQYGTALDDWRRATDEVVRYRGRRFLSGFSESETQLFLGNCLIPLTLRIDPRYVSAGGKYGVSARIENAIAQIAVSRTNSGSRIINLPLLGGTVGAAFIAQKLYYDQLGVPELATNRLVGKTIGLNLAGDLLLNILHEF